MDGVIYNVLQKNKSLNNFNSISIHSFNNSIFFTFLAHARLVIANAYFIGKNLAKG
jgi:hypothetical protein